MRTSRRFAALGAVLLSFALIGCSAPAPDAAAPAPEQPTASPAPAETAPQIDTPVLETCRGILFDTGSTVIGPELGMCLAGQLAVDNTYRMEITSTGSPASPADVRLSPLAARIATPGGTVVITEDGIAGGGLPGIEGLEEAIATAYRPEVVAAFVGESATWTIVGDGFVRDLDGIERDVWQLAPDELTSMLGVPMSDASIWIMPDFRLVRTEATGTVAGITTTSTQLLAGWGEPLGFPELEE